MFKKKTGQSFAIFKNIFLRNRSLSNARWLYAKIQKLEGELS